MIICLDQRTGGGCGTENADDAQACRECGRSLRFALLLHDPDTIIGSYRLLDLVGYGGGGAVYAADDLRSLERVAIKQTFDPAGALSFRDEFTALSRLSHPGLPRYNELFEFGGNGYLAMEFIPGQSMQELIDERGSPLAEDVALDYARQICAVLHFLHGHEPPLFHRDIKPANLRLTDDGTVKLVDFGLLKRGSQLTRKTIRGMGTPAYAPIEQYATSGQHTNARSDIYSLGATLYHLLSAVEPPPATERAALSPDPLMSLHTLNPAIELDVVVAVERAMAQVQADRFASVAEFAAALGFSFQPLPRIRGAAPPLARPLAVGALDVQQALFIQAHAEGIVCLAVRGDGELLAAGSADDTASLWRIYDGAEVVRLVGHGRGVNGLAFTADGAYLATGSADATIKFWQVEGGSCVLTLEKHDDWVQTLAASPDRQTLASAGADGVLWLWQMYDGLPLGSLRAGSGIWSIAWRPDGGQFALGLEDGRAQLRQAGDGRLLRTISAHENVVTGLDFSHDGGLLVTVSNDRSGMIWDVASGDPLRSLDGHGGAVACVACSPDGGVIATGCIDGLLRFYRAADAALLAEVEAHPRGVNALIWLPGGEAIATAGMDGAVCVWKVQGERRANGERRQVTR
ncbi:MAG: protein kinase [Chloroflexales bacterium]|nr:protein kinase [Chloroflexales bacterium]